MLFLCCSKKKNQVELKVLWNVRKPNTPKGRWVDDIIKDCKTHDNGWHLTKDLDSVTKEAADILGKWQYINQMTYITRWRNKERQMTHFSHARKEQYGDIWYVNTTSPLKKGLHLSKVRFECCVSSRIWFWVFNRFVITWVETNKERLNLITAIFILSCAAQLCSGISTVLQLLVMVSVYQALYNIYVNCSF